METENQGITLHNLDELGIAEIRQFTFEQVAQYITQNQLTEKEHNFFLHPSDRLEWNILRDQDGCSQGEFLVFFPRRVRLEVNSTFLVARAAKLNRKIFLTPWDNPDSYLQLTDGSFIYFDSESKRQLVDLSPKPLQERLPLCTQCHDTGVFKEQWKNKNLSKKHDIDRYCTCRAGIKLSYRGKIKRITRAANT